MFCNKCGNQINPGQAFCNKCGNPIQNTYNNVNGMQYQPVQNMNKKKYWPTFLKFIAVAFAIFVVMFIISLAIKESATTKLLTLINILKIYLPIFIVLYGAILSAVLIGDKNKNGRKPGMIIVLVIGAIVVLGSILMYTSNDKISCTSDKGDLIIFYTDDGIHGYISSGYDFKEDKAKELFKQYGKTMFLGAFKTAFELEHGGTCEY